MIPSLLQIPSAVSDSKLHSVLPNNGKGDFQFERSTGATRINRDGLIEEVGYFSSELVQNGNFSELGSELITNGDFATDSDWTLGAGWSINDGKAVADTTSNTTCQQNVTFTSGKTYKIIFTVSDYISGQMRPQFTGGGSSNGTNVSSNGTFTQYITASANHSKFRLQASGSNFTGKVDNVSVKQVDPNDRWTLGTGWSYGTNKAEKTAGTGSILSQSNVVEANKKYKVSFDVVVTAGYIDSVFIGGQSEGTNITASGSYSYIFDTTNIDSLGFNANSAFAGSVTNISVVEVQGDRPRLSYDITNGVVEDQPHLLLEPSATNLVTFSKDFSQWSSLGSPSPTITTNFAISPDGTQNASRYVVNSSSASTRLELGAITVSAASHTFSLYIKNNTGNNSVKLNVYDGSDNSQTFTATDSWQRISYTLTTSATSSCFLSIRTSGDADFLIYGAQLEQQSFATSLIPTAGTTITRAAETCNNSKPSVNSTEGVLYCEIAALTDLGSYRLISLNSDNSSSNRITIAYDVVNNQIYGQCVASGTGQALFTTQPISISDFHKIALKYKANDFAFWVDGVRIGTDTSGSVPTGLNTLSFDRADAAAFFYGKVKGLAVYNEALSESQLMQLTGVTASSIYNNFVTRTASFTVEALNEVKKVIDNL